MRNKPRLIFLLNSAQRSLQQWMATQTEAIGRNGQQAPTPAQSGVIFVLTQGDGATMGELAQALDLAPSAVSGLVQRMEALDWLARRPCPEDRRTQRVWLQPAGRQLLPLLKQATTHINARLTAGFSEAELETVARWLTHVQRLDETHRTKA